MDQCLRLHSGAATYTNNARRIVGNILTKVPRQTQRARKHLDPIIEERYRMMEQYGNNWEDKPNDFLQWLMDSAEGEEKSARLLTQRILTVSMLFWCIRPPNV
jgi:hypothetical protein